MEKKKMTKTELFFCQLNTKELNYLPEVDHEMLKEIQIFQNIVNCTTSFQVHFYIYL